MRCTYCGGLRSVDVERPGSLDQQRAQEELGIVEKLKSKNSGSSKEPGRSTSTEPKPPQ